MPFHLAVVCPSRLRGSRTAVVDSGGIKQRGSAATASFTGAVGEYTMVTSKPLAGCATIATRGSVGSAVPFTPATVEAVPGPAANTVGFQVRNLLFFGGGPVAEAFHTATLCSAP